MQGAVFTFPRPKALDGMSGEEIEAVCAKGLLSQLLGEHRRLGRDDPRVFTRSQLLEDGLPLRCAPKREPERQSGVFVEYLKDAQELRRQGGAAFTKREYHDFIRGTAAEFAKLSPTELEAALQKTRGRHLARGSAGNADSAPAPIPVDPGGGGGSKM